MSEQANSPLSQDTQAMLDCLRQAVSKTLERKRRLGQYSVQWNGKAPFAVGDDAPEALKLREGDSVVFEIDQAGVHLRKAPSIDKAFSEALQGTLNEWESASDDEAYADL